MKNLNNKKQSFRYQNSNVPEKLCYDINALVRMSRKYDLIIKDYIRYVNIHNRYLSYEN